MDPNYWQDKVCVVSGASVGLGLEIARALAARKAKVVLIARGEQRLRAAADQLADRGADVLPVAADLTKQADVDRLACSVSDHFGSVDLLVNCAGRSTRGAVIDTTPEDFEQLMEINFLATVRTTRAFVASLLERRGHVINIGSLASKVAPRFLGGYPASKFALAAYSQQLRLELGPSGLHVLLVCPGPIRRDKNSLRYAEETHDLPIEASQPGGGAKLKQLDPAWLAEKILVACQRRQLELIAPKKAYLLLALSALSPRLGDWLLRRATSGTGA